MRLVLAHRVFLIAVFAALALVPAVANPYHVFIGNMMMLFIILAVGLNLLIGYSGQLALANAAMFGIGAYGCGVLQVTLGFPFWLAAPLGALLAMTIGTAIALPALRLSGIYLALLTLAFAMIAHWVLLHWNSVTYGAGGFQTPRLDPWPLPISPRMATYYLSLIVAMVLVGFAWRLVRSRIGRAFVAIRDGEVAAQALGIDLVRYKVLAFALSGFYAGAAGALYVPLLGYLAPEGFDLFQMIIHKSMVVVGGMGSVLGSVIGAVVITIVLEVLRDVKDIQEIFFGVILIVFVLFRPKGLVSIFHFIPGWREPLNSAEGHATPPHAGEGAAAARGVAAARSAGEAPGGGSG